MQVCNSFRNIGEQFTPELGRSRIDLSDDALSALPQMYCLATSIMCRIAARNQPPRSSRWSKFTSVGSSIPSLAAISACVSTSSARERWSRVRHLAWLNPIGFRRASSFKRQLRAVSQKETNSLHIKFRHQNISLAR
jgi:hypothetical protein